MFTEIFEDPETTCLVCHKRFTNGRVLKRHRRENGHYVPRAPVFRDRYVGRGAARGEAAVAAAAAGGRGVKEEEEEGEGEVEEGEVVAVVEGEYEGSAEEGEIVEVVRMKRKRTWKDRKEWETTDRGRGRDRQWGYAVNLNHIDRHKHARQSGRPVRPRPPLSLPKNQRGDTTSRPPPAPGPHHHQRCQSLGGPWRARSDVPKAFDWKVVVRPIAFEPPPREIDSRPPLEDDDEDGGGRLPEPCFQEPIDPAEDLDVAPYRSDDDEW